MSQYLGAQFLSFGKRNLHFWSPKSESHVNTDCILGKSLFQLFIRLFKTNSVFPYCWTIHNTSTPNMVFSVTFFFFFSRIIFWNSSNMTCNFAERKHLIMQYLHKRHSRISSKIRNPIIQIVPTLRGSIFQQKLETVAKYENMQFPDIFPFLHDAPRP